MIKAHLHLYCDKKYQPKKHQPVTVVVAVEGGVGWWGGAVVEGAVTIVAAEEDDEGPAPNKTGEFFKLLVIHFPTILRDFLKGSLA